MKVMLILCGVWLTALCRSVAAVDVTSQPNCDAEFGPAQLKQSSSYVDSSVEPCSDFYEYACGNWRVPYQLRALQARDTLTALKADTKRQLIEYFERMTLLEPQLPAQQLPQLERALVQFYSSCLDDSLKTERGGEKLHAYTDVLRQYSDWPLLNPQFTERLANASFNWEHVSAQLRHYGVQALLRTVVQSNWQAAEQQIFYIVPPKFDLLMQRPQAAQADEDSIYLYKRYVKYLLLDLGVRVRQALRIADEVVEFERQLHTLTLATERTVVLREPQTLEAMVRQFPHIRLREYFATLLEQFALPPGYEQHLLIVANESYLRQLAQLLNSTTAETIGKYLLVQFLTHFEVRLHEHESFQEQKESCLQQVHNFLPQELSELYLKLQHAGDEYYLQRTQSHLNRIFDQLKQQFERMLNTTTVFQPDALTQVLGLEKLRSMRLLLPKLHQQPQHSPWTSNIGDNYDVNLINLSREAALRQLAPIARALGGSSSDAAKAEPSVLPYNTYGPLDVNVYYRLKKNAIEVPMGILRPPLYDACLPPVKIYGGFVYMLAHELLHGFDYDGFNYDKSGNVSNSWGVRSIIKFGTKASCYLSARYSHAELTLNENMSDTEGLRLALETFQAYMAEAAMQPEQLKLFFLNFAQSWCGTDAGNSNSLHAEHRERVNNAVGNFLQFAEVYKCSNTSAMNPAEKCRIW